MVQVTNTESFRLADQLERSFHGGAWHGPAVREALDDVDTTTASAPPRGGANTIVALVRHLTFWLNAAHIRIAEGREINHDADWPDEEPLTEAAWKDTVAQLEAAHSRLHVTVAALDDARLDDAVPGADPTVRGLLFGTLQHNAYHTGQIVSIKRELAT